MLGSGGDPDGPGPALGEPVLVFTTRVDTIFGATYLVLAPEHPLVDAVTTAEQRSAVDAYRARTAQQDVVSRKVASSSRRTSLRLQCAVAR